MPRMFVFDPTEVGVYHCINRCMLREEQKAILQQYINAA